MGDQCAYFQSAAWHRTVLAVIDRVWSLPEVLDRQDVAEPQAVLDQYIETYPAVDAASLADTPLTTLLEQDSEGVLPFTETALREQWLDSRDAVPDTCPRPTEGTEYCLFHRPPADTDDTALREAFVDAVQTGDAATRRFVGARFGTLDLGQTRLDPPDTAPIDLRYATWADELRLSDAHIGTDLRLFGASVASIAATEAVLDGDCHAMATRLGHGDQRSDPEYKFTDNFADFAGRVDFTGTTFGGKADFKYARFDPRTSFNSVEFHGLAMFNYARFGDGLDLMHAAFDRKADFSKATFDGRAILNATYRGNVMFSYATFTAEVELWNTTFQGMVDCWATTFEAGVDARHARFEGFTTFQETAFAAGGDCTGAVFADAVEFRRVETAETCLDCTGATIAAGWIEQASPPARVDLTDASLGDVTCTAVDETIAVFDHLRLVETDFDGFDFATHRTALDDDWVLHRFDGQADEPSIAELESTYLRARNGADDAGDDTAASAFFRKEMRYRRRRLFGRARESDSAVTQLAAGGRWATNWFFNLTCGYGERPLRTVGFSAGTIVLFAACYWALGVTPAGGSSAAYLTLSLQTFVALILGGVPNAGSLAVQFTAALQAFTGAFLIALFVFALTRSIRR